MHHVFDTSFETNLYEQEMILEFCSRPTQLILALLCRCHVVQRCGFVITLLTCSKLPTTDRVHKSSVHQALCPTRTLVSACNATWMVAEHCRRHRIRVTPLLLLLVEEPRVQLTAFVAPNAPATGSTSSIGRSHGADEYRAPVVSASVSASDTRLPKQPTVFEGGRLKPADWASAFGW